MSGAVAALMISQKVGGAPPPPTNGDFSSLAGSTINKTGTGPYSWSMPAPTTGRGTATQSNLAFQPGVAGELIVRIDSAPVGGVAPGDFYWRFVLGSDNTTPYTTGTGYIIGFGGEGDGNALYAYIPTRDAGIAGMVVTGSTNYVRIRQDASNNLNIDYSTNSGSSWTQLNTVAVAGGAITKYPKFNLETTPNTAGAALGITWLSWTGLS